MFIRDDFHRHSRGASVPALAGGCGRGPLSVGFHVLMSLGGIKGVDLSWSALRQHVLPGQRPGHNLDTWRARASCSAVTFVLHVRQGFKPRFSSSGFQHSLEPRAPQLAPSDVNNETAQEPSLLSSCSVPAP